MEETKECKSLSHVICSNTNDCTGLMRLDNRKTLSDEISFFQLFLSV